MPLAGEKQPVPPYCGRILFKEQITNYESEKNETASGGYARLCERCISLASKKCSALGSALRHISLSFSNKLTLTHDKI